MLFYLRSVLNDTASRGLRGYISQASLAVE